MKFTWTLFSFLLSTFLVGQNNSNWQSDFYNTVQHGIRTSHTNKNSWGPRRYHLNFDPNWQHIGLTGNVDIPNGSSRLGNGIMHALAFDPEYGTSNQTIYAGSNFGGLWRSENGGQQWNVVGTDQLPRTSVSDIAIHPNDRNTLFISTGDADGILPHDTLSERKKMKSWRANMGDINPLFTIGVFRSQDYGQTWHPINNGLMQDFTNGGAIRRIITAPNNGNELYAATNKGVYKTNNALTPSPKWKKVSQGLSSTDTEYKGLEFKPDNTNTLYCSGRDIYITNNGGKDWKPMTGKGTGLKLDELPRNTKVTILQSTVDRINIATTPANPDILYAYIVTSEVVEKKNKKTYKGACAYVYKFENGKWLLIYEKRDHNGSRKNDFENISPSRTAIAVSPVNENELYIGTTMLYGSRNVKSTSIAVASNYTDMHFHADIHGLAFDPANPQHLFCAHDGGISKKDVAVTGKGGWESLNAGLQVSTLWAFDDYEFDPDQIAAAYQDNGVRIRIKDSTGIHWRHLAGGDGYNARIDNLGGKLLWYKSNNSMVKYTYETNRFKHETNIRPYTVTHKNPPIQEQIPQAFMVEHHPHTGEKYFGFSEINKRLKDDATTASNAYQTVSNLGNTVNWKDFRQISEFEISEADPNYRFVSTLGSVSTNEEGMLAKNEAKLFRTTSGDCDVSDYFSDSCYQDLTPNLKRDMQIAYAPMVTGIALHPTNPLKVWICTTGFGAQTRVWYSEDAGDNWINADPNGILTDLPANNIIYQDGTYDRLYLATDAGVYTKDAGSDWVKYGNIPNVRVIELKINYCAGKLRAATFGRGLWESDLMPYSGFYSAGKVISENQTFDNLYIEKNLTISENTKVEVSSEVFVIPHAKISVATNSELILDGTKINYCNEDSSPLYFEIHGKVTVTNDLPLHKGSTIYIAPGGLLLITNGQSRAEYHGDPKSGSRFLYDLSPL